MIITIKGTVTHKGAGFAIIEAGGIGYQVNLSSGTLSDLPGSGEVSLWTHEYIREDARDLYGFRTEQERRLFLQLLDVSGVGPKMALNILSLGVPEEIEKRIDQGDAGWISQVSGVGKKTAQKIILELKGRLAEVVGDTPADKDVLAALVGLGYSREQARDAVTETDSAEPVEKRLKSALKTLSR
jgi:Holliday junction DNA helicase RuvA